MKRRADPSAEVAAWNAKHPKGTAVRVLKDDDSIVEGVTVTEAFVLSGHTAVIHVSGIRGCYLLSRVTADVAT